MITSQHPLSDITDEVTQAIRTSTTFEEFFKGRTIPEKDTVLSSNVPCDSSGLLKLAVCTIIIIIVI